MAVCKQCGKDTTHYRVVPGVGDFCIPDCAPREHKRNMKLTTFPFETENLSSAPGKVTVNSLTHLRQLEREHGVASVAYNLEERNWTPPRTDFDAIRARTIEDIRRGRK